MSAATAEQQVQGGFLGWVERAGNKVPNPAILFLALILGVVLLSQALDWAGVSATSEVAKPVAAEVQPGDGGDVTPVPSYVEEHPEYAGAQDYEIVKETIGVKGLLSTEGIRYMFTSFVPNFLGFTAIGVILIAMIGVGIAEYSGLIAALIRKLVAKAPASLLTYIIVFVGIISSVAADAGYLVLIPLAAVAFMSVGRNPLAGIAAGFGAVSAAFGVNILITPADGVVTDLANEAAALVDPTVKLDLTANLYFATASVLLLTLVISLVTTRIIEPRLGEWKREDADLEELEREEGKEVPDPALESKGLRYAGFATLGVIILVLLLSLPSGAPLRNPETDVLIGDSPLMSSLIVIISGLFLAAGLAYGKGAGTISGSDEALGMITKAWASLASLLFLFLLIAQFIAYFDYSNIARVVTISLGNTLEEMDLSKGLLLLGIIILTIAVNFIIPAKIAKWALLAPIFVPLMIRLGVEPQTVLAAYRVGDSPTNVLTPLMPYFPLMVVFAARYQKGAGIGTVIALMIPYTVAITIVWTVFFMLWFVLGIPLGPGWPV
jgi:aminobenzoyl-glutamate transport protein